MFPELYSFQWGYSVVPISTFGIFMTLAFFAFYWMLRRLGKKYHVSTNFFESRLFTFFVVTFLSARIFHVLLFAGIPTKSAFSLEFPVMSFFLMSDFYLSMFGAVIGFFGVLLWSIRSRDPQEKQEILDIFVIASMFWAILWYLWAFLWWQTYGMKSESILAVDYIGNPVLAEFPRFPIALTYSLVILFIFSLIYIVKKVRPERGLAASLWATLWWIMWFLGEWWNDSSSDNLSYLFGFLDHSKFFNANQYLALILLGVWIWWLAHIIPSPVSESILRWGRRARKIWSKIKKKFKR